MSHPLLIGITYSPWSYKARWALNWHGINYRYQEYLLMLGQVKLRAQLRQRAHATVPAMISADAKLRDSFEIAKWADQQQGGADLKTNTAEVAQWNQISESVLRLGRIRCALSVQDDPAGLRASVPPPMNKLPGATQLAKLGVRYILKTYPINTQASELENQTATHLATVEAALSKQDFLLGTPSYADIAIASSLQFILPTSNDYIPMPSAGRKHWTSESLATQFKSLMSWRDTVFQEMRAPKLGSAS